MGEEYDLLSTIRRVPVSYFVYSAFSYFGNCRGGALPGTWFVKALAAAGREEAVVRQTLYRMERDGELLTRRSGRMKFYLPSRYADAEIQAGTETIFAVPRRDWDGQWTVVRVGLRTPAMAKHRERIIALLSVEGFAQLDTNVFVHPRPAAGRVYEALPPEARAEVLVVRGPAMGTESQPSLVALWHVEALADRYRRTAAKLDALERRMADPLPDREAFLMRFAVVFEYLGVAWDDPGLPAELLPPDWPGDATRAMAARLYERLIPGAIRHADAVLDEVLGTTPRLTSAGDPQ